MTYVWQCSYSVNQLCMSIKVLESWVAISGRALITLASKAQHFLVSDLLALAEDCIVALLNSSPLAH